MNAEQPNFGQWVLKEKQLEQYFDRLFLSDQSSQIQAIYYISEIISEAKRQAGMSQDLEAQIDFLTICGIISAKLESFSAGKTSTEPGKRALNVLCDLRNSLSPGKGEWIPYSGPSV